MDAADIKPKQVVWIIGHEDWPEECDVAELRGGYVRLKGCPELYTPTELYRDRDEALAVSRDLLAANISERERQLTIDRIKLAAMEVDVRIDLDLPTADATVTRKFSRAELEGVGT